MALPVKIIGGAGNSNVMITQRGQLVVSDLDFESGFFAQMTGIGVTNIVTPQSMMQFVIRTMILSHDTAGTDSVVTVFESDSVNGSNVKTVLEVELTKNQLVPLTGLNLITGNTRWINMDQTSTNATIRTMISGFFVELET